MNIMHHVGWHHFFVTLASGPLGGVVYIDGAMLPLAYADPSVDIPEVRPHHWIEMGTPGTTLTIAGIALYHQGISSARAKAHYEAGLRTGGLR